MQGREVAAHTWSQLKTCLETRIGRRLNNSQFTRYLRELRDYGFIEKDRGPLRLRRPIDTSRAVTPEERVN
ncbi:hypothetical protein PYJP_16940 [Pyrofollis japonicus]|uniref:hypothetical protein n=1 Tax=Pyrofollis japonicus TaxID=3060460 RepID=UPI00295A745B|nr:hypothetical protein [Pyrofollis japonicus]BEP18342.1 hypothetical protein PYJP_16940 [Pyrofollis japonicus]